MRARAISCLSLLGALACKAASPGPQDEAKREPPARTSDAPAASGEVGAESGTRPAVGETGGPAEAAGSGETGTDEVPPEEPAAEVPAPEDPLAVLFTAGNEWTYRAYRGWHDSIHEVFDVRRKVSEVEKVGPWEVAYVEDHYGKTSMEDPRIEGFMLARKGDELALIPYDEDPPPRNAKQMRERIDALADTASLARAHEELICGFLGCVGGLHMDMGFDSSLSVWPGVGLVSHVEGDYSPETGDGYTLQLLLTGYSLEEATPTLHVSEEPPELTSAREKLHVLAKTLGAWEELDAALPDSFRYSLHAAHIYNEGAIEAWQGPGNHVNGLVEGTGSACGVLDSTPRVAACPREHAETHANMTGRRKAAAREYGRRAYFVLEKGKWVPRATLLGGPRDVYAMDEASDAPATPLTKYAAPEWDH